MKHFILTGDFTQCDAMLGKILAAHGKHVKGVSAVTSAIAVPGPQTGLKILSHAPELPVTFQNISTITILYQLPGDAQIDLTPFMPETANDQPPVI